MQAGVIAIRDFLTTVDPIRTLQVARSDEEYKELLKNGTAADIVAFFSRRPNLVDAQASKEISES